MKVKTNSTTGNIEHLGGSCFLYKGSHLDLIGLISQTCAIVPHNQKTNKYLSFKLMKRDKNKSVAFIILVSVYILNSDEYENVFNVHLKIYAHPDVLIHRSFMQYPKIARKHFPQQFNNCLFYALRCSHLCSFKSV